MGTFGLYGSAGNRHKRYVGFAILFCIVRIPCQAASAEPQEERAEAMKRIQGIVASLNSQPARRFVQGTYRTNGEEPMCSWRLALGRNPLYGPKVDLPWKSPFNQIEEGKLLDNDRHRAAFTVRGAPSKYTQIFALVGPGTAFTEYFASKGRNPSAAEPDAILLLDCQNRLIHWMEPGDIDVGRLLRPDQFTIGEHLAPNFPPGFLIAFVDGAVWWIRGDVPQEVIVPFFTLKGAQTHNRDDELAKYALDKLPPLVKYEQGYYYPREK